MTTFFPCNQSISTNVLSEIEIPLWIEIVRKERIEPWRYLTMVWWRIWRKRLRPSSELSGERRREPPRLCQCPPQALRNPSRKLRSGHYLRPILKPINFLALELTSPSLKMRSRRDWFLRFTVECCCLCVTSNFLKTFLKKLNRLPFCNKRIKLHVV